MQILDVSSIASGDGMPLKKGSLKFIQDSYKELVEQTLKSIIPNFDSSKAYALYGIKNGTGNNIGTNPPSTGAIFFNGEIFRCDSAAISGVSTGAYVVLDLTTTQYTTDADPVTFTAGGAPKNIHNIRKATYRWATSGSGTLGVKFFDIIQFNGWQQYNLSSAEMTVSTTPVTQGGLYYKQSEKTLEIISTLSNTNIPTATSTVYIDLPAAYSSAAILGSPDVFGFGGSGNSMRVSYDFTTNRIKLDSTDGFTAGIQGKVHFILTLMLI